MIKKKEKVEPTLYVHDAMDRICTTQPPHPPQKKMNLKKYCMYSLSKHVYELAIPKVKIEVSFPRENSVMSKITICTTIEQVSNLGHVIDYVNGG